MLKNKCLNASEPGKSVLLSASVVILIVVMLTACTGADGNTEAPDHILEMENVTIYSTSDIESADTLRLVKEQIFSDTDENPITTFGSVITDNFGRVYIGDPQQKTIHLFMDDGNYLGSFGREGGGPGEFHWVGSMNIQENRLYAYDPNGNRVNIFELGTDDREFPEYDSVIMVGGESWDNFPEPGFMNPAFHSVRSDGSLLLTSRTIPMLYRENPDSVGVRKYYRWSGKSSDKPEYIIEVPEPKHIVTEWFIIPPPFETRALLSMSGDDRIFSADTGEFLIHQHDAEGNRNSSFYYPLKKHELTRTQAVNSVDHEQLRDAVQTMQIPGNWPVLRQMFTDRSERIWISVYTGNENAAEWWVLEESGQLIARFELPGGASIARADRSHLYVRETDEESGQQAIVRYRMEIGG